MATIAAAVVGAGEHHRLVELAVHEADPHLLADARQHVHPARKAGGALQHRRPAGGAVAAALCTGGRALLPEEGDAPIVRLGASYLAVRTRPVWAGGSQ